MGSLPKKSVLFGQVFRKWASFGEKRFHSHYGYWLELLQLWGKVIGQWAHVLRKLQLGWYRSGEHTCIAIYVPITWWGPKKVQSCNRWKSTNCEVRKPSVRRHSAKLKVDATLTLMKFLPISNPASGELTILLFGGWGYTYMRHQELKVENDYRRSGSCYWGRICDHINLMEMDPKCWAPQGNAFDPSCHNSQF